jgi:hypothetical protein
LFVFSGFKERLQIAQHNQVESSTNQKTKRKLKKFNKKNRKRAFDRNDILEFNEIFREFVADEEIDMFVPISSSQFSSLFIFPSHSVNIFLSI